MALVFWIGVFREVAQHDDDLVLHVERGVAVVAEVLALGHHDAVAGEDQRAADLAVVRERQRADVLLAGETSRGAQPAALRDTRRDGRPAVACVPAVNSNAHSVVGAAGQRLRADALAVRR